MFLILFVCILVLLLSDYLLKKRKNDVVQWIPGPKPIPIFGNFLICWGLKAEDVMNFFVNNYKRYGSMYRVWIFQRLAIFVSDPKDLEIILGSTQHITKNNLYDLLHDWLGTGLLMSTGKKWHTRRKIITPTFHFKILEQFMEIYDHQSNIMIRKLYEKADRTSSVDIYKIVGLTALDIIAGDIGKVNHFNEHQQNLKLFILETAMGVKINAQENSQIPYVKAVHQVSELIVERFLNMWQRPNLIFRLTAPRKYKLFTENIKIMHDFTEKIILERRDLLKSLKPLNPKKADDDKHYAALLDVLLQSSVDNQPLNNQDIREEVDTFMFEGHDTVTSGISFTLYLISRHPNIQKKLFEEITEVFGSDINRVMSSRDLNELKYLDCVIKESLRLYPPVPVIGRYLNEDLNIHGHQLPGGSNLIITIYAALRNPMYYDNPNEFIPERFLNENNRLFNPYAYIPFSAGPRNCIGQKFAIMELKCVVSKIMQHFELFPQGPDVKPILSLTLRSTTGVNIGLRPRKKLQ